MPRVTLFDSKNTTSKTVGQKVGESLRALEDTLVPVIKIDCVSEVRQLVFYFKWLPDYVNFALYCSDNRSRIPLNNPIPCSPDNYSVTLEINDAVQLIATLTKNSAPLLDALCHEAGLDTESSSSQTYRR